MIYKIEEFEINEALREVYLKGEKQNIEPKVYDLILFLIKNSNKAISKDELQDAVWPNIEVSETAITRAIMKARKVLNDGKNTQSYIQTVHGHGYKFIAQIEILEFDDNQSQAEYSESISSWWKNKLSFGAITIALLLSFIGVGVLFKTNEVFATDSKLALLPFINELKDEKFNWASVGLMGIAEQMIKAENNIKTVSNSRSSRINNFTVDENLNMDVEQLNSIKKKLEASHIVIVKLKKALKDQFELNYIIYHPNGKQDMVTLIGDNITELTQQMSQRIIKKLPGSSITNNYRAISDNVFTNELYARGVALRLEGKAKEARDYFKLVMKEEPDLFWPRYQFALTTNKLGLYDEAIVQLKQLLEDIPDILHDKDLEAGVNNALGISYLFKSDHVNGIKYYSKAYDLAVESKNREYQEKISSNIAWIYKDKKEYDKSRTWLAKSMNSRKIHNLPKLTNNIYLMGQLEYLMNNFDKAETIFNEAYQSYIESNHKLQAAKVLNLIAKINRLKGQWDLAYETMKHANELSEDIDDDLGRLANQFSISNILYEEGKYSEALKIISENITFAKKLQQEKKLRNALIQEIRILYKLKKYDEALNKIAELPTHQDHRQILLTTSEKIKLKIDYINGENNSLEVWLKEHRNLSFDSDLKDQHLIQEMELFVLEQKQKKAHDIEIQAINQQLIERYRAFIELNYTLGYHSSALKKSIKMANLYIELGDIESATDLYGEISLHNLNWWQIDLLNALIEFKKGNIQQAREKAEKAKRNSTELWKDKEQSIYKEIVDSI